jgi:hypothetical protein
LVRFTVPERYLVPVPVPLQSYLTGAEYVPAISHRRVLGTGGWGKNTLKYTLA